MNCNLHSGICKTMSTRLWVCVSTSVSVSAFMSIPTALAISIVLIGSGYNCYGNLPDPCWPPSPTLFTTPMHLPWLGNLNGIKRARANVLSCFLVVLHVASPLPAPFPFPSSSSSSSSAPLSSCYCCCCCCCPAATFLLLLLGIIIQRCNTL